jgi:hypothetical protein
MRWLFLFLSPLLFLFCEAAMAVEEPRYTVLVSDPPFEVRRYAAFTVAQTQISGDFDAASRSFVWSDVDHVNAAAGSTSAWPTAPLGVVRHYPRAKAVAGGRSGVG